MSRNRFNFALFLNGNQYVKDGGIQPLPPRENLQRNNYCPRIHRSIQRTLSKNHALVRSRQGFAGLLNRKNSPIGDFLPEVTISHSPQARKNDGKDEQEKMATQLI